MELVTRTARTTVNPGRKRLGLPAREADEQVREGGFAHGFEWALNRAAASDLRWIHEMNNTTWISLWVGDDDNDDIPNLPSLYRELEGLGFVPTPDLRIHLRNDPFIDGLFEGAEAGWWSMMADPE